MQTLLKQSIIGGLSFLLLTGIAFSVGSSEPSVFEGEAAYTDLLISEYYESNGSTHKAIELFNGTSANIVLSNYSVVLYTNGASTVSAYVNLSGNLNIGNTLTIYNTGTTRVPLGGTILSNNSVINFNGDDVIALYNNGGTALVGTTGASGTVNADMADEILVDIIGVIGQDGNNAGFNDAFLFTSANNSVFSGTTKDSIMVRTREIVSPNATFTGSEWLCFPVVSSTSSGLLEPDSKTTSFGSHSSATLDKVSAENYSYLLLNTTTNKVGSCTEESLSWSSLQTHYQALTSDEKTAFKTNANGSTNNSNALNRYNYLIAFNPALTNFVYPA
jgi:hypothetical protein